MPRATVRQRRRSAGTAGILFFAPWFKNPTGSLVVRMTKTTVGREMTDTCSGAGASPFPLRFPGSSRETAKSGSFETNIQGFAGFQDAERLEGPQCRFCRPGWNGSTRGRSLARCGRRPTFPPPSIPLDDTPHHALNRIQYVCPNRHPRINELGDAARQRRTSRPRETRLLPARLVQVLNCRSIGHWQNSGERAISGLSQSPQSKEGEQGCNRSKGFESFEAA